jgi:predicted PurR-regulated permease PerM
MDELAQPAGGLPTDGPRVRPPTPRVALILVAAAIVGVLLYLGREALAPFVIGLVLVYLLDPAVERLSRGPLPRWLAILIVYAITIGLVAGALAFTLQPLVRQLTDFLKHLPELFRSFDALLQRLGEVYADLELPQQVRDFIDRLIGDFVESSGGFDPTILLPVFTSVAGFLVSLAGFLVIPVWVFYLLKDRPALTAGFDRSLPPAWRDDTWAMIHIVDEVFARWVRGQLVLGLTVGIATFVGLEALSVLVDPVFGRFAVFFAILAGLLELLPIVGPILSAIAPLLVALTVSPVAIVAVLLLYFAIQQVENTVLVPKIQGDAIRLHPSAVIFALIVGGAIAGLIGAILALPIAAAGRDVFRHLFRRLSAPRSPGVALTPAPASALSSAPPPAPSGAPMPDSAPGSAPAPVAPDSVDG